MNKSAGTEEREIASWVIGLREEGCEYTNCVTAEGPDDIDEAVKKEVRMISFACHM